MGHFQFWLLAAFALSLFSLFFIQIKSRLAAITQVFNTVAISAFIGGIIGGYIGKAVLKKHFAKSGII